MSIHDVCGILRNATAYNDYAVISFYTVNDPFSGAPEEFYAECGNKTHILPLCSKNYAQDLESTKNAVIAYLNKHSHFFIFDLEALEEYDDASPLEDFIRRALEEEGYTRNFIGKQAVFGVIERVFSSIKPTSPSDLGMMRCVLL